MFIQQHNCETGEITLVQLTAEEIAHSEKIAAQLAAEKAEAQAKASQRQALLARLGITEEEARILLGGN